MSIAAVDWAFKQTVGGSAMKFLLVAMANYADERGFCYPSVRRLTEDTEQDRKTILKHIAKLEFLKLLEDTNNRCGRTRSVPVYRLLMASSPVNGTASGEAVPNFPGSSPVFPPKRSQKRDTDPSGTVIEPPKGVLSSISPGNKAEPVKMPTKSAASALFVVNQAIEEATGPAKAQLKAQKKAILSKATGIDITTKPKNVVALPVIESLPVPEPAWNKGIAELKATVAATPVIKPIVQVMKRIHFKRPAKQA